MIPDYQSNEVQSNAEYSMLSQKLLLNDDDN